MKIKENQSNVGMRFWVAALVALLQLFPNWATGQRLPVVFDTDIGDDIDDTWALVMLLKSDDRASHPSSRFNFSGLAQRIAGSPGLRWAIRVAILCPVTSSTALITSRTE